MKRLEKSLQWWLRFNNKPYGLKLLGFLIVIFSLIKFKTLKIAYPTLKLIIANIFRIKIYNYPSDFLPVMINTNCSLLSFDEQQSFQCMNGSFGKSVFGEILSMYGTNGFIYLEKAKKGGLSNEKIQDCVNKLKINTPENEKI